MSNYRIRKSPSGKHYRVQHLKQTLRSLFIRVFLPSYPRQYQWKYVIRMDGSIAEYCTKELAMLLISELKEIDMDSNDEDWSIIQV